MLPSVYWYWLVSCSCCCLCFKPCLELLSFCLHDSVFVNKSGSSCDVFFQHGALVNAMDLWQFTPLHEAAAKGRYGTRSAIGHHWWSTGSSLFLNGMVDQRTTYMYLFALSLRNVLWERVDKTRVLLLNDRLSSTCGSLPVSVQTWMARGDSLWKEMTFQKQCPFLLATVIAEISVRVENSYCSVRELSYAINFRTARTVSRTLLCMHGFRMLLNFVLSAKSTKSMTLNRVRKFLRLQDVKNKK